MLEDREIRDDFSVWSISAGTRVEVLASYDNSKEREADFPIDTSRAVTYGAATTDEMMAPFLAWTYVEPDEVEQVIRDLSIDRD